MAKLFALAFLACLALGASGGFIDEAKNNLNKFFSPSAERDCEADSQESGRFECERDGVFPHPYACGRYVQCGGGEAAVLRCPPGRHFSAARGKCEDTCDAHCDRTLACQCGWPTCRTYGICLLPKKIGRCNCSSNRYYFDRRTGGCSPFEYGGCGGNENNFATRKQCERKCLTSDYVCKLPKHVGSCRDELPRFYFDSHKKECVKFSYGGCQGNGNNFKTKGECEQMCQEPEEDQLGLECDSAEPEMADNPWDRDINAPELQLSIVDEQKKSLSKDDIRYPHIDCKYDGFKPDPYLCNVYYQCVAQIAYRHECPYGLDFSVRTRTCVPPLEAHCDLRYGKLEGEDSEIVKQSAPVPNFCYEDNQSEECKQTLVRYYYDKKLGYCTSFVFGGCGATKNNFETYEECSKACSKKSTSEKSNEMSTTAVQSSQIEEFCYEDNQTEECKRSKFRYYFNKNTNLCTLFHYTGCGATKNNFGTSRDCSRTCMRFFSPGNKLVEIESPIHMEGEFVKQSTRNSQEQNLMESQEQTKWDVQKKSHLGSDSQQPASWDSQKKDKLKSQLQTDRVYLNVNKQQSQQIGILDSQQQGRLQSQQQSSWDSQHQGELQSQQLGSWDSQHQGELQSQQLGSWDSQNQGELQSELQAERDNLYVNQLQSQQPASWDSQKQSELQSQQPADWDSQNQGKLQSQQQTEWDSLNANQMESHQQGKWEAQKQNKFQSQNQIGLDSAQPAELESQQPNQLRFQSNRNQLQEGNKWSYLNRVQMQSQKPEDSSDAQIRIEMESQQPSESQSHQVEQQSVQRRDACYQDQEPGYCSGSLRRFFFDVTKGDCKPFVYSSCGGNENNFLTKEECRKVCVNDTD